MTRTEVIAIARDVGMCGMLTDVVCTIDELERFAALVAEAEREACAALIESATERSRWIRGGINGTPIEPCQYAAAIRARGMP